MLQDIGPPRPRCGDCPRARDSTVTVRAPPAILVLGSKEPWREDCNGEGHGQGCVCGALWPQLSRRTLGHPLLSPHP